MENQVWDLGEDLATVSRVWSGNLVGRVGKGKWTKINMDDGD